MKLSGTLSETLTATPSLHPSVDPAIWFQTSVRGDEERQRTRLGLSSSGSDQSDAHHPRRMRQRRHQGQSRINGSMIEWMDE